MVAGALRPDAEASRGRPRKPSEDPPDVVETVQKTIIRAGLDEAQFWGSTPYQSLLRIKEAQRAQMEGYLATGWMAERFAREKVLKPLSDYLNDEPEAAVDEAEALRDWAKRNDAKFARPEADPQT